MSEVAQAIANKSARVGVLMGGMSTERQISLKSGRAVQSALEERGHTVIPIDVGPDLPAKLITHKIDAAWLALHGSFGEDGCVQGLLEVMRIPYTGSSAAASAMAMDKIATKRLLQGTAVRLPSDHVWRSGDPIPTHIPLPVVAKTPTGGSTIGIYLCNTQPELEAALTACQGLGSEVLLEQMVTGEEITVALLDGRALPVVAIRPEEGFFDFEAKYTKGKTQYLVPAPISDATREDAQEQARISYRTMNLSGIARADFIVDTDGKPWFLEVNTIPGMTATSLSPMAAGAAGISFGELVEHVLFDARLHLERADN